VIRPTFDWPVGLTAEVMATRHQVHRTPERTHEHRTEARYRMRVLHHARGRLIRRGGFEIPPPLLEDPLGTGALRRAASELAQLLAPGYIVSRAGELVGVVEAGELREAIASALEPLARRRAGHGVGPEAAVAHLPDAILAENATLEWGALVGFWTGRELDVGRVYETRSEEPVPFLAGTRVPMVYRYAARAHVACPGEDRVRCVELERTATADMESFRATLERTMEQMGAADGASELQELEIDHRIRLIAEPTTLRPHSLEIERRVGGAASTRDGGTGPFQIIDRRSYRFRYP
jgi:hypothetical protein